MNDVIGQSAASMRFVWHKLPPLPDERGFAGVFAGVSHGALIVAGGTNFPDKQVWEGGKKVWYDKIFVLEKPDGKWETVSLLQKPLGYGVSVTTDKGLVCIGGADADRHYADVFLLEWNNGKVKQTPLPSLPKPVAYASGALIGNLIYIAGGIETPTATRAVKTFWSLDLSNKKAVWREVESWPGPGRMLGVSASANSAFYLFSGASLSAAPDRSPKRSYLNDAYRYLPGRGWKRIADVPAPILAAPTPAARINKNRIVVFGGDDGSRVGFQPIEKHPGFSHRIFVYGTRTDRWQNAGATPAGQVTTALVAWHGGFVIPSGEVRPGVRSPNIWFVRPTLLKRSI